MAAVAIMAIKDNKGMTHATPFSEDEPSEIPVTAPEIKKDAISYGRCSSHGNNKISTMGPNSYHAL